MKENHADNKKNYTKITPTLYVKPVESDAKDDKGEKIQIYDILNPETEMYEDISAKVEFTLYVGRIEPFEADEYDWNILWIEGSDWVDEQIVDKAIETDFDIKSIFY